MDRHPLRGSVRVNRRRGGTGLSQRGCILCMFRAGPIALRKNGFRVLPLCTLMSATVRSRKALDGLTASVEDGGEGGGPG